MLQAWADRLVRLGTGAALFLLLAAEQKVCPWLLTPPNKAGAPRDQVESSQCSSESRTRASDSPASGKPKRQPLSLISALPDALPARWPAPGSPAVWQEVAGRQDGVVACGSPRPEPVGSAHCALTPCPMWTLLCRPPRLIELAGPRHDSPPIQDPAIRALLLRTGPPA